MTPKDNAITPEIKDAPLADAERGHAAAHGKKHDRKFRTTGNKLFDWLVYPTIAFGVVFAVSAWMMHTTKYGSGRLKDQYDKSVNAVDAFLKKGPWLKNRSDEFIHNKAQHYVKVLISFVTGTILILPIKLFEDARGKISRSFDRMLGTTPQDQSLYQEEPKQGWKSVLGGRTVTFATVLAISSFLGKQIDDFSHWIANAVKGGAILSWVERENASGRSTPSLDILRDPIQTPKYDSIRKWSYCGAFEAIYSAYCAVALYALSRTLARWFNRKNHKPPMVDVTLRAETPIADANSDNGPPRKEWAGKEKAPAESRTATEEKRREGAGSPEMAVA